MANTGKVIKKMIKTAQNAGWRVVPTEAGWQCYPPEFIVTKGDTAHDHAVANGWQVTERKGDRVSILASPVTIHRSPSDHRWDKNTRSEFAKRGLIV